MNSKVLKKRCEKCLIFIPDETLMTGPVMLCRACSDRYIANLAVDFELVE